MYGETVNDENDSYRMKVPIKINQPEMGILLDECGCNLSQEGDNNYGGELYVSGLNDKVYVLVSTRHHHFTVIGVTLMDRSPLICVVIVSGKSHDLLVELGIDVSKLSDLNINLDQHSKDGVTDETLLLLKEHCGENKLFPGLPSCMFKGIEVP